MKRRSKAPDEWADLIQAGENSDDDNKNKNHTGKVGRRVVAVAVGVAILIVLMSVSKKGTNLDSEPQNRNQMRDGSKRRNRKVVLLGPHDRYNDFGDIIAERVVSKLLVDRAGFVYDEPDDQDNTLLLGGVVTRDDMDHHGLTPHKTIYSMKAIQKMSRDDVKNGPYDIVFTGGSGEGPGDEGPAILYEKHKDAVEILEMTALRNSATADRVYDCPYLFPKELLLPIVDKTMGTNTKKHATGIVTTLPRPRKNYAIVDSLETPPTKDDKTKGAPLACRRVVAKADHMGLRGSKPFAPDTSVMMKELYGDEIKDLFETQVRQELLNFPQFASSQPKAKDSSPLNYIAVQHETVKHMSDTAYAQDLAEALDEVSRNLGNAPVVFFPAGLVGRAVGDHFSYALSTEVAGKMKQPSVLYHTQHAFKVAALIHGAKAVVSTNLHVYILSFVYQKPRAMWHGGVHHETFLKVWEAGDVASMGMVSSVRDTWKQGLQQFFVDGTNEGEPKISQTQTEAASEKATRLYLKNFDKWSNLLITPTEKEKDYDNE